MSTAVRRFLIPKAVGWREAGVLLVAAWAVPFLVHLVPWAGPRPLGVYLLPIFWTTFVALYFYGALPGLAIGLVAPLVNLALTGLPAFRSVGMMGMEVALFVAVASWVVLRWPGFWFGAPLAWVATKAAVIAIQVFVPGFDYTGDPLVHLARSAQNGVAGLGMLMIIHWLLVMFYPKTDPWEE